MTNQEMLAVIVKTIKGLREVLASERLRYDVGVILYQDADHYWYMRQARNAPTLQFGIRVAPGRLSHNMYDFAEFVPPREEDIRAAYESLHGLISGAARRFPAIKPKLAPLLAAA